MATGQEKKHDFVLNHVIGGLGNLFIWRFRGSNTEVKESVSY